MDPESHTLEKEKIPKDVYVDLRKLMRELKLTSSGVLSLFMKRHHHNAKEVTSRDDDVIEESFFFDTSEEFDTTESHENGPLDESFTDVRSEDSEGNPILKNPVDEDLWRIYLASGDDECTFDNDIEHKLACNPDFYTDDTNGECITCYNTLYRPLDQSDINRSSEDLKFFLDENWKDYAHEKYPCEWHEEFGCEICKPSSFCVAYDNLINFHFEHSICESCIYHMAQLIDKGWFYDGWEKERSSWSDSEAYEIMSQY